MFARVVQSVAAVGRRYGVTGDLVVLLVAGAAATWGAAKLAQIADQSSRNVVEAHSELETLEHAYAATQERYRALMQERRQWLKDNPHPAAGLGEPSTETVERVHEGLKKL